MNNETTPGQQPESRETSRCYWHAHRGRARQCRRACKRRDCADSHCQDDDGPPPSRARTRSRCNSTAASKVHFSNHHVHHPTPSTLPAPDLNRSSMAADRRAPPSHSTARAGRAASNPDPSRRYASESVDITSAARLCCTDFAARTTRRTRGARVRRCTTSENTTTA